MKERFKQHKQLSYRRETALQGGLVIARSGRLELEDNIYGQYKPIMSCLLYTSDAADE